MSSIVLARGNIRISAFAEPVEAIAISNGKVLATGGVSECVTAAGKGARFHDLDGASVIPGLVESHVHPIFFGLTRNWSDCRSPKNRDILDVQNTLRADLTSTPRGGWLRGWGYDDTLLSEGRHLTRDDLDEVSSDIPIVISHISGHFLVANSKALAIAEIHETTPDPAEGKIVKDSGGIPTGLMWELGAVNLVLDRFPMLDAGQLESAAKYAMSAAASRGMTTIHDLGIGVAAGLEELGTWERLAAADSIPIRVNGYLRGDLMPRLMAKEPRPFHHDTPGNFQLKGAKYWVDGSIQGLSAALIQPYSCAADTHGELLIQGDELLDLVQTIDRAGGQCAVHANGDLAVRTVVDTFAKVRANGGRRDARHRIEHLQMASAEDIRNLVAAGGVGSIFANHIYYWGDRHRDIFIGDERASRLNPLAEAAASGLHFGLHSDCPITPMDSLRTLWTAVVRETSSGQTLGPEQRLSPEQALHSLTADSAWLSGDEKTSGTLQPGKNADIAIIDRDIITVDPGEIERTEVLGTMVGGEWVFLA